MKKFQLLLLSALFWIISAHVVQATIISYDLVDLGLGSWEYTYTVDNNTLAAAIDEFSVYFDYGLYDNLAVTSPLLGWDELVVNPDLIFGFPENGYYDAAMTGVGINPGEMKTGFSVSFDWLGQGTPGSQHFEIIDPNTFNILDQGQTQLLANNTVVPEPATMFMLGSGILGLFGARKKKIV